MLGFLKGDPKKKLQKAYEEKLAKALDTALGGKPLLRPRMVVSRRS